MRYFLKKTTPSKKGRYLQIYITYYDPEKKAKRNKSYKALGYVCDLIESGINDPEAYYKKEIDKMNVDLIKQSLQISDVSPTKNAGYFLVKAMFDLLDMDKDINIVAYSYKCHYEFSNIFRTLTYAQIIDPGSKLQAFEKVIPNIYGVNSYSYDQILDAINFIGSDYHKYVEVLNKHISKHWKREYDKVYFDCTNYYFEIDLENDFLKKGPSKENRKQPLIGQALLLDADQLPLDTRFYPGNESEKPLLRERVEDMKARNNITGKVIQVADKGLNCARNVYAAVIEANDGYIFSKSLKGRNLKEEDKELVLKADDKLNIWVNVNDAEGNLYFKYKVLKTKTSDGVKDYVIAHYECKLNLDDTKKTKFDVKEKRIVTYNPSLARKQRAEIKKQVEKLMNKISFKQAIKEDLGDAVKYLNIEAKDQNGEKVNIATSLNQEMIDLDLKFCGYNMLVTSELDSNPIDVYKTYHRLWRIEESFRLLKSYLEARPVFLQKEESIYGHFLICYIALTIIRLLELKTFNDEIAAAQLFKFIRQYNITKTQDGSYINNAIASKTYYKIKEKLGLLKLGNVYLSKKDIDLLLQTELDV